MGISHGAPSSRRKNSYSESREQNCVEVGGLPGTVVVRDTQPRGRDTSASPPRSRQRCSTRCAPTGRPADTRRPPDDRGSSCCITQCISHAESMRCQAAASPGRSSRGRRRQPDRRWIGPERLRSPSALPRAAAGGFSICQRFGRHGLPRSCQCRQAATIKGRRHSRTYRPETFTISLRTALQSSNPSASGSYPALHLPKKSLSRYSFPLPSSIRAFASRHIPGESSCKPSLRLNMSEIPLPSRVQSWCRYSVKR